MGSKGLMQLLLQGLRDAVDELHLLLLDGLIYLYNIVQYDIT